MKIKTVFSVMVVCACCGLAFAKPLPVSTPIVTAQSVADSSEPQPLESGDLTSETRPSGSVLPEPIVDLLPDSVQKKPLLAQEVLEAVPTQETPTYGWTVTYGDVDYDQGNDLTADAAENIYMTGQFIGKIEVEPGRYLESVSPNKWDVMVVRLSRDGKYRDAFRLGGIGAEEGRAITLTPDGDLLIAGSVTGPNFEPGYEVDFDPTEGVDLHYTAGMTDIFITKISPDGKTYYWTRMIGGPEFESPTDMVTDADGNIYLTGYFMDAVDFDPGPGADVHYADNVYGNVFITKLEADGSYGWTRSFGGAHSDYGQAIAVENDGSIWVTGYVMGDMDGGHVFVPGWGQIDTYGGEDIFIAHLDKNGNYLNFYCLGGPYHDEGRAVQVDQQGHAYIGGYFHSTIDLDPTKGEDFVTSAGSFDGFIIKLGKNGEYLGKYTFGGPYEDWVRSIDIDPAGSVIAAGAFSGTVDFDNGPDQDLRSSSNGSLDICVIKLESDLSYGYAATVGGINWDEPQSVVVDWLGNPVYTGGFIDPIDFDFTEEGVDVRKSAGWVDAFVSKIVFVEPTTTCIGDMNCDGSITYADVDLFVASLSGEAAWPYTNCAWLNADTNGDGEVTFADIDPFVALLGTECP